MKHEGSQREGRTAFEKPYVPDRPVLTGCAAGVSRSCHSGSRAVGAAPRHVHLPLQPPLCGGSCVPRRPSVRPSAAAAVPPRAVGQLPHAQRVGRRRSDPPSLAPSPFHRPAPLPPALFS